MRVSRVLMAAGLAVLVSVGSVAILSAQAKTDEDYDKLMKGVGAANGAMRKAAKEQNAAGVAAEAAKLVVLFKDAQAVLDRAQQHGSRRMGGRGHEARRRASRRPTTCRQRRRGAHEGARRHLHDLPHEVSREDGNRFRDQEE